MDTDQETRRRGLRFPRYYFLRGNHRTPRSSHERHSRSTKCARCGVRFLGLHLRNFTCRKLEVVRRHQWQTHFSPLLYPLALVITINYLFVSVYVFRFIFFVIKIHFSETVIIKCIFCETILVCMSLPSIHYKRLSSCLKLTDIIPLTTRAVCLDIPMRGPRRKGIMGETSIATFTKRINSGWNWSATVFLHLLLLSQPLL